MAKKIDPKAKAKKQKIYAAIGGVLLLGLLAFQVPRTMKMLHPPNVNDSAASTPASTTPTTGPIAAPSLSGGNATAVSSSPGGDGLADPDAVPLPESGQLLAFGRFRTKDPFVQQLKLNCTDSSGAGCAPSAPPPSTGSSKPPELRPGLRAGLGDRQGREDRHRRRRAREWQGDGDAEEEQAADADEHRRRHALRVAVPLGQLARSATYIPVDWSNVDVRRASGRAERAPALRTTTVTTLSERALAGVAEVM
jgi:hypothetical protein